jgi:hypothetical protein
MGWEVLNYILFSKRISIKMELIYIFIILSILTLYVAIKTNNTVCPKPEKELVEQDHAYDQPKISKIFRKMFSEPSPRQGGIGMAGLTT